MNEVTTNDDSRTEVAQRNLDSATKEAPSSGDEHFLLARDLSVARFDHRLRWGALLLLVSILVPYEVVGGQPQFVWQVVGELSWAARLAAFSLPLVGAIGLLAARYIDIVEHRVVFVVAAFVSVLVIGKLGADASAWDVLSIPSTIGDSPALLILPFACAGAGAALIGRQGKLQARARVLLGLSPVFTLLLYLVPVNGTLPLVGILQLVGLTLTVDDARFALGYGMITATVLLPALVSGAALAMACRPPRKEVVVPSYLMTYALPFALGLFVARHFFLTLGNSSVLASALGLLPLVAGSGISAATLEVLFCGVQPTKKSWGIAAAAVFALTAAMWVLALPPEKGVRWKLDSPTAQLDTVFGKRLRSWNLTRRGWGIQNKAARSEGTARQYVQVRKAGHELIETSRKAQPELARPMRDLVFEGKDLDLAGRRWFRLIRQLNETNRSLNLPYYVDPTVDVVVTDDGPQKFFDLESYRIEKVRPFQVNGTPFAALHVRSLGKKRRNHDLLGFSRDVQPFAVIALDELDPYAKTLTQWATADSPICFDRPTQAFPELARCAQKLRALHHQHGDLKQLALLNTERHELQHQIDGPHLSIATAVHDRMGPYASWARTAVNRELSAYLAELTTERGSPALGLILLLGNAYGGGLHGKYTHASILAFEALLDRQLAGARNSDRKKSQAVVTAAYNELAQSSDEEIRQRARAAWEEAYGVELVEVRPFSESKPHARQ